MVSNVEIQPLELNPGGIISPDDLIGREQELQQISNVIARGGSVQLLGDRRMGKTTLLRKIHNDFNKVGHTVILVSGESGGAKGFGSQLLKQLRANKVMAKEVERWTKEFSGELSLKIGSTGISVHGKTSSPTVSECPLDLFDLCLHAVKKNSPHYKLIFLFDEITALVQNLEKDEPGSGKAFLQILRAVRQTEPEICMVMAGSIGLHHALPDMSPVNDLENINVGAFTPRDAIYLARCLLRGLSKRNSTQEIELKLAQEIAQICSNIPYYIQHLVKIIDTIEDSEINVYNIVQQCLENDTFQTDHYDTRIPEYYPENILLTRIILDQYAHSTSSLSVDDLLIKISDIELERRPSKELLSTLIKQLEKDHYLKRCKNNHSEFVNSFLKNAWRVIRRLDD